MSPIEIFGLSTGIFVIGVLVGGVMKYQMIEGEKERQEEREFKFKTRNAIYEVEMINRVLKNLGSRVDAIEKKLMETRT